MELILRSDFHSWLDNLWLEFWIWHRHFKFWRAMFKIEANSLIEIQSGSNNPIVGIKMLINGIDWLLRVKVQKCNWCLVHLLPQNLVRAYSNFLSMLNFLCILKIVLVYSKVRFLYINWLIWVYLKCFEYTLKIWVYLKI